MLRHWLSFIPTFMPSSAVAILILYLTLFPKPLPDMDIQMFDGIDKVAHLLMMYGLTGTIAFDTLRMNRYADFHKAPVPVVIVITTGTIIFGGAIELAQGMMGLGRGCDILDFIADTTGSLLAMASIFLLWPPISRWYHNTGDQI